MRGCRFIVRHRTQVGADYTQASFGYVVQTQDGAEGVVDVGMRSEYATLREAIAAQALERLVAQCGDQADVALGRFAFRANHYGPRKYSASVSTIRPTKKKPVGGGEGGPTVFVRFAKRRKWATVNRWCGLGSQQA
ncbi:MAG: hypothetical protein CM15mP120_11740 [Pseudomonadota bacterium]|nr:MAG: hypothetical protein CM15mP120_11740 [Pseudomonadota bacterium]